MLSSVPPTISLLACPLLIIVISLITWGAAHELTDENNEWNNFYIRLSKTHKPRYHKKLVDSSWLEEGEARRYLAWYRSNSISGRRIAHESPDDVDCPCVWHRRIIFVIYIILLLERNKNQRVSSSSPPLPCVLIRLFSSSGKLGELTIQAFAHNHEVDVAQKVEKKSLRYVH